MPFKIFKKKGKHYIKWGDSGKPYQFNPNSKKSTEDARKKAEKQMRAIRASQARRKKELEEEKKKKRKKRKKK